MDKIRIKNLYAFSCNLYLDERTDESFTLSFRSVPTQLWRSVVFLSTFRVNSSCLLIMSTFTVCCLLLITTVCREPRSHEILVLVGLQKDAKQCMIVVHCTACTDPMVKLSNDVFADKKASKCHET